VNRQITQLFGLFALLFGLLVVFTSRWTVIDARSLENKPSNRRALIQEQRVPRGVIYARDDKTVLAKSVPHGQGQSRVFSRTYPTGPLFSHAIGYSFILNGRRGLEESRNDDLAGKEDEFASILSGLESRRKEGFDLVTNLDPAGQKTAIQGLGGQKGAVVAIEPATGKVRVMASVPAFDANQVPRGFSQLNRDPNKPLFNRATQELYPPGSTFKVVTATAALDSGKATPGSIFDGHSPRTISGAPLANAGGENFGPITLTDALTNSVNTVFAQVGERVGRSTLLEYMDRFGFNEKPKLDYPSDQMIRSGIRNGKGELVTSTTGFDIGRVAIGQGGLEGAITATPLQMAEVAATVANGGKLMKPRFTDRIVRKDGRVKQRIEPDVQTRVMKPQTAKELGAMMTKVVEEGTATAAALQGIHVAGKTGTAEVDNGAANQAWFIAFAPVEKPKIAIAVTIERTQGQGGTVAAPIAKQVLQTLLKHE
jgi:peptidoglycan glycosyltransferase